MQIVRERHVLRLSPVPRSADRFNGFPIQSTIGWPLLQVAECDLAANNSQKSTRSMVGNERDLLMCRELRVLVSLKSVHCQATRPCVTCATATHSGCRTIETKSKSAGPALTNYSREVARRCRG